MSVGEGTAWLDGDRIELQGTRDLNPQPLVLETSALPVELVPSGERAEARARNEESTTALTVTDHRGGLRRWTGVRRFWAVIIGAITM